MFDPYVARVPDGDILERLEQEGQRTAALLQSLDEGTGRHRYAEGKWTVKRVFLHIADSERVFACRALCFARGDATPLPGFDENLYASNDGSDDRSLAAIATELATVRAATLSLFRGFGQAHWQRQGVGNGLPVTVASLPWVIAGHELHHRAVLRERYGVG